MLNYRVHGLGLRLSGEPRLLAALDARLESFASDTNGQPDLRFEFTSGDAHTIERPAGDPRPVYHSTRGEVVYDDATDQLYMAFGERIRALCEPEKGLTRVAVYRPEPDDLWLLSHPILTLPLLEMLKRRGLYAIHAAGVGQAERGLILAGGSGSGKTTLAVALARSGFDFLGDDMLFLTPGHARGAPLVRAFHDEVDVTETTASFFPELVGMLDRPRQPGWPKWSFRAERLLGTTLAWSCQPSAVVFPRIADAATSRLEPMAAQEALLELVPNVLLTEPASCQQHLRLLGQLTEFTPCYRLWTGRDFATLPALLGELIARGCT